MKIKKSSIKPVVLCGVKLPTTNYNWLAQSVQNLPLESKSNLFFLYSEFIIRANSNPDYQQIINRASYSAIDGRGLEWASYNLHSKQYSSTRSWILFIKLILNLAYNFFEGFVIIFFAIKTQQVTNNELILGRDFVYQLLQEANKRSLKVHLIGSNSQVQSKLQQKYPGINLQVFETQADSSLMQDIGQISGQLKKIGDKHSFLNENNLLQEFPDLEKAASQVAEFAPDLVLVCLGGASGKQEFFLDLIQSDTRCKYRLGVGVGAALDHLGGGEGQKRTNKFLESRGLEWLYRIVTNPKRAYRTWYSIYTLWWLVSLQPFVEPGKRVEIKNLS